MDWALEGRISSQVQAMLDSSDPSVIRSHIRSLDDAASVLDEAVRDGRAHLAAVEKRTRPMFGEAS